MRYYNIVITDPTTGKTDGLPQFTSFVNGKTDPGALTIELDIPVAQFAQPMGGAMVRVWGISLQTISQAKNLTGKSIAVYGGMQKGLPLANPAQARLLVSGTIYPAFGNWIGTEMTLDLIIVPYLYAGTGQPANIVLNWKAGVPLATALGNALKVAFPNWPQKININPNLILSRDAPGYYGNLNELSDYLNSISRSIVGGAYAGVRVVQYGNQVRAFDGSTKTTPIKINFQDLIGQPTWLGLYELQFKCVMRGDIGVGDFCMLPPTLTTTTSGSSVPAPVARDNTSFQGNFLVQRIRHVGAFRQPDAASWNTTFDVVPDPDGGPPPNVGPPISAPTMTPP